VVEGIAESCRDNNCVIIKGECGAKPKIYQDGRYDCVGAVIGVIKDAEVPDEFAIAPGDTILGLGSNGLHSTGFSLFRMVADRAGVPMSQHVAELGCRLGEEGLKPHRLYLPAVRALKKRVKVKGVAHITIGGIPKSLPRILPDGTSAIIYHSEVVNAMQPIFKWIQEHGNVPWEGPGGMIATFNMGIGLTVIVDRTEVDAAFEALRGTGDNAFVAGQVVEGDEQTVEFV
jgi:phosphoribosylformylglycinamidine cyclo-ligase